MGWFKGYITNTTLPAAEVYRTIQSFMGGWKGISRNQRDTWNASNVPLLLPDELKPTFVYVLLRIKYTKNSKEY